MYWAGGVVRGFNEAKPRRVWKGNGLFAVVVQVEASTKPNPEGFGRDLASH